MLTNLPTASEIRTESRLTKQQLNIFDDAQVEADINARIAEQASVVEQRLMMKAAPYAFPFGTTRLTTAYPKYTGTERGEVTTRQQTNAGLVVEMFVLSDLYLTAGTIDPHFLEKAKYYVVRGESILTALESEVAYIAGILSRSESTANTSAVGATLRTGKGIYRDIAPDDAGWWQPQEWQL